MNKLLTATLIILVISLIFLYFGALSPIERYFQNQDRIAQLRDLVKAQKQSVTDMETLKKELNDNYKQPLEKVAAALPAYADTPSLLQFLTETSQKHGVVLSKIGKISIGGGAQKSSEESGATSESTVNIKKMTFHISVNGSYDSLNSFLLGLERNARLIEITNLNTSQGGDKTKANLPKYDLTLTASFY